MKLLAGLIVGLSILNCGSENIVTKDQFFKSAYKSFMSVINNEECSLRGDVEFLSDSIELNNCETTPDEAMIYSQFKGSLDTDYSILKGEIVINYHIYENYIYEGKYDCVVDLIIDDDVITGTFCGYAIEDL